MTESTTPNTPSIPKEFVDAVQGSLELLNPRIRENALTAAPKEALPGLLDQCLALLQLSSEANDPIQIRTVHHLACTGGTLIAKCLSALPNVQLLSEIDPHSKMSASQSRFSPTDLTRLARYSTRGVDETLISEMFLAGLEKLVEDSKRRGLRLILRDHSHSQFCHNALEPDYLGLREVIRNGFQVASVVTVRHPIDSYLSLIKNNWKHFTPFTLDEYARRYLAFLDQYGDCEIILYEDFVQDPESTLQRICNELKITYDPSFLQTFFSFELSGDSGRKSNRIKERSRRQFGDDLSEEALASQYWDRLCNRLGYSTDIRESKPTCNT